jgi:carbon-monoxide dehydrogenase medium subunit
VKFKQPASRFAIVGVFVSRSAAGVRVPADGPSSDLHASAEHRAHRVTVLARRAVAQAG